MSFSVKNPDLGRGLRIVCVVVMGPLFVGVVPVAEEGIESAVGEWVFEHAGDDLVGDGDDIGAGFGNFDEVERATDGGGEDFGFEVVVVIDLSDVVDEVDSVAADVIETAEEWTDEKCTGLGGEECLEWLEAERQVGADALRGEA